MPNPWNINDLDLIGYADVIPASALPAIVPPIFRSRSQADTVIVPPYKLRFDVVVNPTLISFREAESLRDSSEVTFLLTGAIPAQPDHDLWLDKNAQLNYQPTGDARKALVEGALDAVRRATEALIAGNLELAESAASEAIRYDDQRTGAFAIKTAIRLRRNNPGGARLMADFAKNLSDPFEFNGLVSFYLQLTPDDHVVSVSARGDTNLRNMATCFA